MEVLETVRTGEGRVHLVAAASPKIVSIRTYGPKRLPTLLAAVLPCAWPYCEQVGVNARRGLEGDPQWFCDEHREDGVPDEDRVALLRLIARARRRDPAKNRAAVARFRAAHPDRAREISRRYDANNPHVGLAGVPTRVRSLPPAFRPVALAILETRRANKTKETK